MRTKYQYQCADSATSRQIQIPGRGAHPSPRRSRPSTSPSTWPPTTVSQSKNDPSTARHPLSHHGHNGLERGHRRTHHRPHHRPPPSCTPPRQRHLVRPRHHQPRPPQPGLHRHDPLRRGTQSCPLTTIVPFPVPPANTPPPQQVNCRPTDPTHHQLARADAVFRKGIPSLAAGRRDACDVAPAMGRCEHLWCGAKSGIYLCPRTNENGIHFSCSEAALYAFAAVVECRGGKGVMGRTWDGEGRFTVEVWGGRCV